MRVLKYVVVCSLLISACQQNSANNDKSDYTETLSGQLGNAVLWYQRSAEMQMSYLQAYDKAEMILANKIDTVNANKQFAVVLDLDETVLDNSPYEARLLSEGEVYSSESWKSWCREAKAEALPGAAKFLDFAEKSGVEVFYISNRSVEVMEATLKNLNHLQLPNADREHVFLKLDTSDKTDRRAKVAAEFSILLFIGDNLTDYKQLFADRDSTYGIDSVQKYREELLHNFIMLPNPMYGEWESAIYGNDFSISDSLKLIKRQKALKTAN